MRIQSLPKQDKEELDSAFKSCKKQKEANRIQVIRLLSKHYSHEEVSRITGKSEATIEMLVTLYIKKGIAGLRLKPRIGNNCKLSKKQKDIVKSILFKYDKPSIVGLKINEDEDFWSMTTLRLLVKQQFKRVYKNIDSYRRLFLYCGYSYQRVEFEDKRKNQPQVEEFKKRFKMKLKKGDMSMYW